MVSIHENYKDYEPPAYVHSTIARLLGSLLQQYLSGLESVVLTNAAAIGRGKTRRVSGKKYSRNQCRGFYHRKSAHGQPWIEIVVDNVIGGSFFRRKPRILPRIPFMQDLVFWKTLFHEIGHHLDFSIGPLARGAESSAEAWAPRLMRGYFRKRYWYLMPLIRPAKVIVRAVLRRKRKQRNETL